MEQWPPNPHPGDIDPDQPGAAPPGPGGDPSAEIPGGATLPGAEPAHYGFGDAPTASYTFGEPESTAWEPPVAGLASPGPAVAEPTYLGNQQDMTAFLAMIAGVGTLAVSCIPCFSCVTPIFALVAGVMSLRGADLSLNPGRTRTNAWLGIATGALFVVGLFLFFAIYGAVILAAIQEANQ